MGDHPVCQEAFIRLQKKSAVDLKEEIKKFEKLQSSLSDFGASDSEPNWYFESLMTKAIKGLPLPEIKAENWQLYESVSGWKGAAAKLTRAAEGLYHKIQSAPHKEAVALAEYYGWRTAAKIAVRRVFIPLHEYGCVVTVDGGVLLSAPLDKNGDFSFDDVSEVSAPESQEFLNEVNKLFGTKFKMKDFSGR